jgi:hypothetical protein
MQLEIIPPFLSILIHFTFFFSINISYMQSIIIKGKPLVTFIEIMTVGLKENE